MTKVYVSMSKDYIDFYLENAIDGFLFGIEDFSMNFNDLIKIDELEDIVSNVKKNNVDLYLVINRVIYNDKIEKLKEVLKKVSKLDIDGVFFNDLSVLNIVKEENLNINLLYMGHLATNYKTINFYEKRGIKGALLSTEITKDEIIEIKKNTNSIIGCKLYGYLNMATSSRSLLTNYFEFIKKKKQKDMYFMEDKVDKNKYRVVEKDKETNFFTGKVLNGLIYLPELIDNNIDFIYLDDYLIDHTLFFNATETFSSLRNAKDDKEFVRKLNDVCNLNSPYETYLGFLDKKTIFKVKNNE